MTQLLEILGSNLTPAVLDQISGQIGANRSDTSKAIAAALPTLVAGLARNANQSPAKADSLAGALDRDHRGDLLTNLVKAAARPETGNLIGLAAGMLGGSRASKAADGAGILEHVLGTKRRAVETGVSKASGLGNAQTAQLLEALGPMVMSGLSSLKQTQGLDAQGVAKALASERKQIKSKSGGVLDAVLDHDDDGQIADDVARIGMEMVGSGILGKLFS